MAVPLKSKPSALRSRWRTVSGDPQQEGKDNMSALIHTLLMRNLFEVFGEHDATDAVRSFRSCLPRTSFFQIRTDATSGTKNWIAP
jgi:hypothetical protein